MPVILEIIFHGDLTIFLKRRARRREVNYSLNRRASVKDIIESLGVPHTEIGQIKCDTNEIGFRFIPEADHRLDVYPVTPPLNIKEESRLRPFTWNALRFIVDENAGKLAALLRLLGFDTSHQTGIDDSTVATVAENEKRVVLSRDMVLFKRKSIACGRYLRAVHPYAQLREVLTFFGQNGPYAFLSRCVDCNTLLRTVDKSQIIHRLEPNTQKYYDTFKICPHCNRILWRGSHCERLLVNMQKAGIILCPSPP